MSHRSDFEHDPDFEYCGDCCVCGEPVDHSGMGNCGKCGGVFHWKECGDWGLSQHECDDCKEEDGDMNRLPAGRGG